MVEPVEPTKRASDRCHAAVSEYGSNVERVSSLYVLLYVHRLRLVCE